MARGWVSQKYPTGPDRARRRQYRLFIVENPRGRASPCGEASCRMASALPAFARGLLPENFSTLPEMKSTRRGGGVLSSAPLRMAGTRRTYRADTTKDMVPSRQQAFSLDRVLLRDDRRALLCAGRRAAPGFFGDVRRRDVVFRGLRHTSISGRLRQGAPPRTPGDRSLCDFSECL